MIKLISKFCSLQKYYPTKLVSPKEWIAQTYIPIFKQREFTEKEQKSLMYLNGVKLLPITGFSLYWLFYGSLDLIHFFGFSGLFLFYAKQRLNYLQQDLKKPKFIYMNKNGLDYVCIFKKNSAFVDNENEEQKQLKEQFQLNEQFGIIRFNVNDFKIVISGVEPKTEYEFANLFVLENAEEEMLKKQHNIFEIDVQQNQFQQNLLIMNQVE